MAVSILLELKPSKNIKCYWDQTPENQQYYNNLLIHISSTLKPNISEEAPVDHVPNPAPDALQVPAGETAHGEEAVSHGRGGGSGQRVTHIVRLLSAPLLQVFNI